MYTQTLVDDLKAELCQSLDYWKMSADTRIELPRSFRMTR